MHYTIVMYREPDGSYSVSVPALKGCHTCGDTIAQAIQMAEEAISLFVESLQARGLPVPKDAKQVTVQTKDSPEVMLYRLQLQEEHALA